jgi:hypothetical protein
MVVIGGDRTGVPGDDMTGCRGERVPDGTSTPVHVDGTLYLVRRRRRAPQEPRWERASLSTAHRTLLEPGPPLSIPW